MLRTNNDFPRRNELSLCLGLLALAAGFASKSTAAVLAEESFDYPSGAFIAGESGGTGFAGAWLVDGAETNTVREGSLSYENLTTSGNSLDSNFAFIFRELDEITGTPGTTTWMSFLFNLQSSSSEGFFGGCLTLSSVSTLDAAPWIGAFFNNTGELVFGLGTSFDTARSLSTTIVNPGQTYLLVTRIDWKAGGTPEDIRLFIDPVLGETPLNSSAAAYAAIDMAAGDGSNRISWLGGASAVSDGSIVYDEIRLATSFAETVPVPEPGSVTLLILTVSAGLALRKFQRTRLAPHSR